MSALARRVLAVGLLLVANAAGAQDDRVYRVGYDVRVVPTERAAHVSIRISDPQGLIRSMEWRIDPERHRDFKGPGVETDGDTVRWAPGAGTHTLRYVFRIDHLRDERSYDARCGESWAVFRGDDLVPPVRVRSLRRARSDSRLRLRVPDGWSAATPYRRESDGLFRIDNPRRRFDRPVGWFVVGRLGILRETVAGSRLAVAAPVGQHFRRLDVLALLRWTLPALRDLVGELPTRMLIAGAGDPMWRGGLSGPRSVFIHASRPLITEDGTSPVLHELTHAALALEPGEGGDWIVEGLAELFSLESLVRSRTLSRRRYEKALARLEERGRTAASLHVSRSEGEVTARAVTVLRRLDAEIRSRSDDQRGLPDAVRVLMEKQERVTTERLRAAAEQVSGADLSGFFRQNVGKGP